MKGIISKVAILLTIFSTSAFASTDEELVNANVNITVKSAVEPEHVIATTTLHLFEFEVNLGTHEVDGVKVKKLCFLVTGSKTKWPITFVQRYSSY